MKKDYPKTERRGLPGGPNEFLQNITQYMSVEGYKSDSPDVNNPFNIIESSNITMEDVDFPVRGYGNNGVVQDMTPGVPHYDYGNADYVVEVPMAQDGGDPEMLFKDEYNTALTKEEKIEYETWVASESKRQGRDIMWDLGTYDIQGFWKSGDHMKMDEDNHGSDRWKKPNHPTFSDQSNYHNVNGFLGGTWAEDGAYTPAAHTRKLYDNAYYEKLFGREPGRIEHLKLEEKQKGGGLLDKTMKCNSCGWSWKAADGGADVSTCHKCGGSALPMAQKAGEIVNDENKDTISATDVTDWDDYTIVPDDGIKLNEVVITGKGKPEGSNSLEGMPDFMKYGDGDYTLSAEQQQQLKDLGITDLDSYNEYFGTSYSRDNALNEFNYLNYYKPEREELISSIHGATNTAAKNIMEAASFIPMVRGASLLSKTPQALKYLANSPVGNFAAKYGTKYIAKPFSKVMNYRPVSTGATVGQTLDGAGFVYGVSNVGPDAEEFINNPTLGNAGTLGLDMASIVLPGANAFKALRAPTGRGVNINQFSDRGISPTNFDDVADVDIKEIVRVKNQILDEFGGKPGADLTEGLEMLGRNTDEIDAFITMRLDEIKPGTEGFNRLVKQELKHLENSGYNPMPGTTLGDAAESGALARYQELSNLKGNTINHHAKNMLDDGVGNPSSEYYDMAQNFIQDNSSLFTNAYFRNPAYGGTVDDIINVASSTTDGLGEFSFMTRLGLKPGKGTIGVGPMFNGKNLNAVLDHEIGHMFNANRPIALSDDLRVLKPNSLVNSKLDLSSGSGFNVNKTKGTGSQSLTDDYDYFATGSPNTRQASIGDEPIPFVSELRRSMQERGLLEEGIYTEITPDILNAAKKSFTTKPTGLTKKTIYSDDSISDIDSFFSTTRLLDFLDPSTYPQLSKLMNKAPAIVPPAVIGASALQEQKKGGSIPKAQDGGRVSNIWESVTGTPWSSAKEQGLTDGSYDLNIKLRSELLNNPNKFKPAPSNQLSPSNAPNAPINTLSGVEIDQKINGAQDFSSAFRMAREHYGPNKIFNYNNKNYGTNLKGEDFNPSDQDMSNSGLRQQEAQDIQVQNELVASPYSTTDIVEIDEYEDIADAKSRINDYNKMSQADIIVNYQNQTGNTSPYVVVDKEAGLMHVYEPGNTTNEPIYSSPIDLGAVMGDAQTVTKYRDLNEDGITNQSEVVQENIDWSAGNKSTGAGRYKISNIDKTGYLGKPIFNFTNASGEEVGTSFHTGFIDDDNSRVSNGCIRCNQTTLDVLTDYLENTSEVFILPEDEGNKFVYENGQLNFKQGSGKDYLTYTDGVGNTQKGQGLNRTTNTLNYKPIEISIDKKFKEDQFETFDFNDDEEYNKTVLPFVKSLQENKQLVMKTLKINGDVYNDIAGIAFGIFGNETGFGDTHSGLGNTLRGTAKVASSLYDKAIDSLGLSDGLKLGPIGSVDYQAERYVNNKLDNLGLSDANNSSMGLTQVRWSEIQKEPELVKALANLGITKGEDFDDPTKAALGTVGILSYLRNNRQGGNVSIEDLPRLYAGSSSSDPGRGAYTRNALKNSKYLNIRQKKFQQGGPVSAPNRAGMIMNAAEESNPPIITNDLLLRQLFKESSLNPDAVSAKDAKGIAQFTPITITEMKRLKMVGDDFNPLDIKQAIPAQKKWMNYLSQRPYLNKGTDESVMAKILFAYNAGATGAKRSLTDLSKKGIDIYESTDWTDSINNESSDYINKILKKKNTRFNDEFENIIIDPKYNDIMEYFKNNGGSVRSNNKIYNNYIKGVYKEGGSKDEAQKVYDKLNRINYKDAKLANMSVPNYVMTQITANS